MSLLEIVLAVKIIFTAFLWSLPLLLFPEYSAKLLDLPRPSPILFTRLLGAAFLALLVGYILGLIALRQGKDIQSTVHVGIVSNGLACLILLLSRKEWRQWSKRARSYLWLSTAATFLITVGLVVFGLVFNNKNK